MIYAEHDLIAGDRTDETVVDFPALSGGLRTGPGAVLVPRIRSITLSSEGPTYGWVLFLAPAAAAAPPDIVIVDARATLPITTVAPLGAGVNVVNLAIDCTKLIPMGPSTTQPMTLRVTTSGKGNALGTIRVAWGWAFEP